MVHYLTPFRRIEWTMWVQSAFWNTLERLNGMVPFTARSYSIPFLSLNTLVIRRWQCTGHETRLEFTSTSSLCLTYLGSTILILVFCRILTLVIRVVTMPSSDVSHDPVFHQHRHWFPLQVATSSLPPIFYLEAKKIRQASRQGAMLLTVTRYKSSVLCWRELRTTPTFPLI